MKILYVAIKYHQGNPKYGFSFEHNAFYSSMVALDGGSHDVVYFPFDEIMLRDGKDAMNKMLIETAKKIRPDFCFVSLISDEIRPSTISQIKDAGFVIIGWFGDDHFRFESQSALYANSFSCVVTTFSKAIPKYLALGQKNIILTTWGANTDIYYPANQVKDIDISFIGSWNKEREKIINGLKKAGINVVVYGQGWRNGRISEDQIVDIISRSKINLGLNPPSFYIGFRPLARLFLRWKDGFRRSFNFIRPDIHNLFRNINEWWHKRVPQIKARVFEVSACRTLLITKNVDGLENYYTDKKEIVLYSDSNDLINKIKYYLVNDQEREAIARAAYERTVREHTYAHRLREVYEKAKIILKRDF